MHTYNLLGREYHTKMAVKRDCWGQYGIISGKLWDLFSPGISANSFLPANVTLITLTIIINEHVSIKVCNNVAFDSLSVTIIVLLAK